MLPFWWPNNLVQLLIAINSTLAINSLNRLAFNSQPLTLSLFYIDTFIFSLLLVFLLFIANLLFLCLVKVIFYSNKSSSCIQCFSQMRFSAVCLRKLPSNNSNWGTIVAVRGIIYVQILIGVALEILPSIERRSSRRKIELPRAVESDDKPFWDGGVSVLTVFSPNSSLD